MKDIVTPVPPEETRGVIKKCLENAALVNYTQLSNEAKMDGKKYRESSLVVVIVITQKKIWVKNKKVVPW